ncbi:sulfatase family protein [Prescottella subtropica]|uniref:sulfatase family protein n=1 Tax=Prescottella subtropica TaxID=2545757 RepID=UPI0010F780E8|nr:sulfatase-like hydrolase/transferase [Prescottella subtropica]
MNTSAVHPSDVPNIVLIIADQLRADHVGFGGNRVVRTENMDSVAAQGTRFDRAYVANPICMPNRASMLTSRVPSSHGTRYNGIALDPDANTFVRSLRSAGYRTMLVGKAHFQNIGHQPEFAARATASAPERDAVERAWAPDWDRWENLELHKQQRVEIPEDYYGFDHVELAIDHADYCGGHYEHWLREQGFDPDARGSDHASETSPEWGQIYRPAMPAEVYPTAWVGNRSADLIRSAAESGQPFFLQCSFPDPHHPFTPPDKYYDMYSPADVELPVTFDDPHTASMPHVRSKIKHKGSQRGAMSPFAPTEKQYRDAAAKEYGAITFIDDAVGTVLDALAQAGVRDNTIIVITSDHGDMFGDHGLMLKAGLHYEGCVRVPLVISTPGETGGASDALVSSLDIGPTLLDLAGVEGYAGVHGHSLTGVMNDPTGAVRDRIYIEEDQMFELLPGCGPLQMRTLVDDNGRITVYRGTDDGELFLYTDDPGELVNRWRDPTYAEVKARYLAQLVDAQLEHTDMSRRPTAMA